MWPYLVVLWVTLIRRERNIRLSGERRAWETIPLCCPCPQVCELAAFRAKGAPCIVFPGCRSTADRATHDRRLTWRSRLNFFNFSPCVFERNGSVERKSAG